VVVRPVWNRQSFDREEETTMRNPILIAGAAAALLVWLPNHPASAQSPAPYINLVELVVVPSELSKFLEFAKDNAATAIKEPGVREFNITQLASNPNHVVFYEVYDNEAALTTHRATDHFKKYQAATANMVADRNVRAMAAVEFHSAGH
jgi:quinol monooxygenase YgiN